MQLSGTYLASDLGAAIMTGKVVRWDNMEGCAVMYDGGQARQH